MTIASKPHIPFLWGIFLRLDSSSSCCDAPEAFYCRFKNFVQCTSYNIQMLCTKSLLMRFSSRPGVYNTWSAWKRDLYCTFIFEEHPISLSELWKFNLTFFINVSQSKSQSANWEALTLCARGKIAGFCRQARSIGHNENPLKRVLLRNMSQSCTLLDGART